MKNLIRSTLTLAASFFAFLLIVIFIPLFTNLTESTATWFSVPIALIIGWYTWKSLNRENIGAIAAIFTGAILIGGIFFTVGFIGPLILAPNANLGPLIGILITGPLGLIVGAIAGFIYWLREEKPSNNMDPI